VAEPLEERMFAPPAGVRHAVGSAGAERVRTRVLRKDPPPAFVCQRDAARLRQLAAPWLRISPGDGRVYRYGEGAFEREVEAALARQPMRVDISDLKFIDSAGLAVPVRTAASVGQVSVRNPSPILHRVPAATGLTDLLGIEP
jgi:anti-anti-sigma factor